MRARRSFLTVLTVAALAVGLAGTPAAPAEVHSGLLPPTFPPPVPDLILYDGVVITVDSDFRVAQAVAVKDGRILAVGKSRQVLATQGPRTTVVDLQGRTVLPGFVDPHVHYLHDSAGDLPATLDDQQTLLSWGRTTVGIPAARPRDLAWFQKLDNSRRLELRLHTYLAYNTNCGDVLDREFWQDYPFDRSPDLRLAVAGVKVFMDGGSCNGPAVSFDFDTAPIPLPDGWTGHGDLYLSGAELGGIVSHVDAYGGMVVVHAIGDRAVDESLLGFARAAEHGATTVAHRIDHNTFVRPELEHRYGELGVNAVVWGIFNSCIEPADGWGSFLEPDELSWLRRHRMLIDANPEIAVAFHSDAPATDGDPFHQLLGLTEMAQYHDAFGGECDAPPWLAGHGVTIEEALQMMTIRAAEVMGLDDAVGSIEVGKRADLVVLDHNPLEQSGYDLLDNQVAATYVEGQLVWCHFTHCGIGLPPVPTFR